MAKQTNRKNTSSRGSQQNTGSIPPEVRDELISIGLIVVALLLFLSNFRILGRAGNAVSDFMLGIFGIGAYVLPAVVAVICFIKVNKNLEDLPAIRVTGILLSVLMLSVIGQCISAMAAFWSIREKYDRLQAVFGILKDDNHSIIEMVKEIEKAYTEFCNEGCYEYSNAAKHLDRLCNALPDRAWIM